MKNHDYYLFTRWGRTGSTGQSYFKGPFIKSTQVEDAFQQKFLDKVGFPWNISTQLTTAAGVVEPLPGKYQYHGSNTDQTPSSLNLQNVTTTSSTNNRKNGGFSFPGFAKPPELHDPQQVDPGLTKLIDGGDVTNGLPFRIFRHATIANNLTARLVLFDPAKNADKYYILQVLELNNKSNDNHTTSRNPSKDQSPDQSPQYFLYTRWGRTGTGGRGKLRPFIVFASAEAAFATKFKSKVGAQWGQVHAGTKAIPGKYEYASFSTNWSSTTEEIR